MRSLQRILTVASALAALAFPSGPAEAQSPQGEPRPLLRWGLALIGGHRDDGAWLFQLDQVQEESKPSDVQTAQVVVELELSPQQQERFRAIRDSVFAKMGVVRSSLPPDRDLSPSDTRWSDDQVEREVQRLEKEAVEQSLGVLTPHQRYKLIEMGGETSELEPAATVRGPRIF